MLCCMPSSRNGRGAMPPLSSERGPVHAYVYQLQGVSFLSACCVDHLVKVICKRRIAALIQMLACIAACHTCLVCDIIRHGKSLTSPTN